MKVKLKYKRKESKVIVVDYGDVKYDIRLSFSGLNIICNSKTHKPVAKDDEIYPELNKIGLECSYWLNHDNESLDCIKYSEWEWFISRENGFKMLLTPEEREMVLNSFTEYKKYLNEN